VWIKKCVKFPMNMNDQHHPYTTRY